MFILPLGSHEFGCPPSSPLSLQESPRISFIFCRAGSFCQRTGLIQSYLPRAYYNNQSENQGSMHTCAYTHASMHICVQRHLSAQWSVYKSKAGLPLRPSRASWQYFDRVKSPVGCSSLQKVPAIAGIVLITILVTEAFPLFTDLDICSLVILSGEWATCLEVLCYLQKRRAHKRGNQGQGGATQGPPMEWLV